jgi:hypothetical protein
VQKSVTEMLAEYASDCLDTGLPLDYLFTLEPSEKDKKQSRILSITSDSIESPLVNLRGSTYTAYLN